MDANLKHRAWEALRFAASRSVISAAEEKAILAALATPPLPARGTLDPRLLARIRELSTTSTQDDHDRAVIMLLDAYEGQEAAHQEFRLQNDREWREKLAHAKASPASPAQGTVERAEPVAETLPVIVSRAASVICEVGALCGWPGPECKSEEAAQALFDAGLLASPPVDSDALKALRECLAYIRSPLRMTRDEDEDARRDGIIKRANAALNASVGPK